MQPELQPDAVPQGSRPLRRRIGAGFIAAWAIIAILGLGSLSVSHTAAMPAPDDEVRLARAAAAIVGGGRTLAYVHVIDPACSCTAGLLEHLIERGAYPEHRETILFTGDDPNLKAVAEQAGFGFVSITRAELGASLGIEVAPVLVALAPDGGLLYLGGYFDKPAAVLARDTVIHRRLLAGQDTPPFPVFGCAVSENLRKRVDPMGIVYRDN